MISFMKHSQNDRIIKKENRLEFARGERWGKEGGVTLREQCREGTALYLD